MSAVRTWLLAVALCASLPLLACDPKDPCDPGYNVDHGLCIREVESPAPDADGGVDDGGTAAGFKNDDSDFGRTCQKMADCGGKAPVCGAPMLPLCTAVNCLQGESECPTHWTCLDISSWDGPAQEIKSLCVMF